MVIGYHLIMTAYGWWLPNDPRGSTSRCVASDVIAELGELHFGRKRMQPASREVREFYERAAEVLRFPLLEFDQNTREAIAEAFNRCLVEQRYTCYGCAILQDHVHLLIRKHRHLAEDMIQNLQQCSAERVRSQGLRGRDHPVWVQGGWKVFLDEPDDIRRTINYIHRNPPKHRLAEQRWVFVTPYDGWPLRNSGRRG